MWHAPGYRRVSPKEEVSENRPGQAQLTAIDLLVESHMNSMSPVPGAGLGAGLFHSGNESRFRQKFRLNHPVTTRSESLSAPSPEKFFRSMSIFQSIIRRSNAELTKPLATLALLCIF